MFARIRFAALFVAAVAAVGCSANTEEAPDHAEVGEQAATAADIVGNTYRVEGALVLRENPHYCTTSDTGMCTNGLEDIVLGDIAIDLRVTAVTTGRVDSCCLLGTHQKLIGDVRAVYPALDGSGQRTATLQNQAVRLEQDGYNGLIHSARIESFWLKLGLRSDGRIDRSNIESLDQSASDHAAFGPAAFGRSVVFIPKGRSVTKG